MIPVESAPVAVSAATLNADPSLINSTLYLIVGQSIVLVTLVSLYFTCTLMAAFFKRLDAAKSASAPLGLSGMQSAPQQVAKSTPAPEFAEGAVYAVIAAAVATALDQPHKIVSAGPVQQSSWSTEGRRQIFSSHQLGKR